MESLPTQTLQVIDIRFSQISIRSHFSNGIDSVQTWEERSPYTDYIKVCQFSALLPSSEYMYISIDNRRLYSRKQHTNDENINVYIFDESFGVPLTRDERGVFGYFVWKGDDNGTTKDLEVLMEKH